MPVSVTLLGTSKADVVTARSAMVPVPIDANW